MKLIIAGTRTFDDYDLLESTLDSYFDRVTEVVSGCARGADMLGERWAEENDIPIKSFPANWTKHGKQAGMLRNGEMARYADEAIVFWDGMSRGSKNMVKQMETRGKPCRVVRYGK